MTAQTKSDTYKAFRLLEPRKLGPVQLTKPKAAQLKEGQLLVKLEASTICGSDMPKWNGSEWSAYPAEPGLPLHECVGTVVISKSPDFQQGDRVLAMPIEDHGLQEFFVAEDSNSMRVDKSLSLTAATLIQPLATALYAVERLGDVRGKTVLVIGLGSLGHLTTWLLKNAGSIIATVDPICSVLHEAWRLGTHHQVKSDELLESQLDAVPDIVVEVVGHQEQTVLDAIRLVKRRGTVLVMGVPRPNAMIDLGIAFRKNVALISSVTPPWRAYFAKAQEVMLRDHEQLEKVVTHYCSFDEAALAYGIYEDRSSGRLKVAIMNDTASGAVA